MAQAKMQQEQTSLTTQELVYARDWIKECSWGDLDRDDVDDLTDKQVERGISKSYSGGIEEFKRSCKV